MDGAPGAHKRFLRHVLALAAVGHIARNQAHDLVLVFAHQQVESPRITLLYALDKRAIDFFFAHPGLSPLTRTSATRRCRTAKGAPKFIATPLLATWRLAAAPSRQASAGLVRLAHQALALGQQCVEGIARQRPAKQVALQLVACMFAQKGKVRLGFPALGAPGL